MLHRSHGMVDAVLVLIRAILSAIVAGVVAAGGHVAGTQSATAQSPVPAVPKSTVPKATSPAVTPAGTATSKPAVTAATTKPFVPAVARKYGTGNATQMITVTAASGASTTASLAVWTKSGTGWKEVLGRPITAHLGADGVGRASETISRTPAGSFTLTQAFGALSKPTGTRLPYTKTDPYDWWISQAGPLYNTFQRCTKAYCGFRKGDPNEHLYYERPYYNYAVVIDYNRKPVKQGAGSAFFLHVTYDPPTAGCVSIPQSNLVSILKWLNPADHPRIVIGVP